MGPKEEDWVLVSRRFDSSFWKLINLEDREREPVTEYGPHSSFLCDLNDQQSSVHVYHITFNNTGCYGAAVGSCPVVTFSQSYCTRVEMLTVTCC